MATFLRILILFATLLFLSSCDTSINKYAPINDTEKEIIEVLNAYLESRNSNDVKRLSNLFADDGEYIAGDGNIIKGKDGIAQSDPNWWTYYGKQKLFNLEFNIEERKATVLTTGKWALNIKYPQIFYLIKNDGKWLFSKIEVEK